MMYQIVARSGIALFANGDFIFYAKKTWNQLKVICSIT